MTSDELQNRIERFWQDKARGLLLGQACADGLANTSFDGPLAGFDDQLADEQPVRHTATTELALGAAEYLANHEAVRHADAWVLQTYLAHTWWAGQQRCGFGLDDTRLFQAVLRGSDRPVAAVPRIGVEPAVVVAPFALTALSGSDLTAVARMCCGLLTHDVIAHAAAAMFASAAALALATDSARPIRADRLIRRLHDATGPDGATAVATLQQLAAEGVSPSAARRVLLAEDFGAVGPVAAAVLAFLNHSDSAHKAVRYAVHLGGPATTVPSMTGALAGARHGLRGLPTGWRSRLDGADKIETLADRLARRYVAVPHRILIPGV